MQALQELYEETEKSHSQLLKRSKQSEEKIGQLVSDNKILEQKLYNLESKKEDTKLEVMYYNKL